MKDYKLEIEKIARLSKEEQEEFNRNNQKIRENNVSPKESLKHTATITAGGAGAGLGAVGVNKTYRDGLIDGRVKLYHNTTKENTKSILAEGLKGRHGTDENSFTKTIMKSQGRDNMSDFDNKVYLARKKSVANGVGMKRSQIRMAKESPAHAMFLSPSDLSRLNKRDNDLLKASVPFEEFKRMKRVENPEVMGAKTKKEFVEKMKQHYKSKGMDLTKMQELELGSGFKALGKDTVTLSGDFGAKNFVGGAGYKKNSAKEILDYAAKNKARALKGVGLGLGGAALIGTGAVAVGKGVKDNLDAKKRAKEKNKELVKRQEELYKKIWTNN